MTPLLKQTKLNDRSDISVKKITKKFLTFTLSDEGYAIDILNIQEIKGFSGEMSITKITGTPPHIKGVIYLHDAIIPVIDLRTFYHLKIAEHNEAKIIIVLKTTHQLIGLLTDTVVDIIDLTEEQIKPAPEFCAIIHHNYIQGIAVIDEHMWIILDVEKLIGSEELQLAQYMTTLRNGHESGT